MEIGGGGQKFSSDVDVMKEDDEIKVEAGKVCG